MAIDPRLHLLTATFDFTSRPPAGRVVLMAARLWLRTPMRGTAYEFPAQDRGAKVPGGRVHGPELNNGRLIEIATWNTGAPSDLKATGNGTHAETQFHGHIHGWDWEKVEVEISHSPCTACCDMLGGLIRGRKVDATLRWGKPYEWGVQRTTAGSLRDLIRAGWKLAAPGTAIPASSTGLPVRLL